MLSFAPSHSSCSNQRRDTERCGHITLNTVCEERPRARAHGRQNHKIFGLEHAQRVCQGVIIQRGRRNINNNSVFATYTHPLYLFSMTKRHCFCKNKIVTAAMIPRFSSGHMFTQLPDPVEIISISDQFEILHFVNIEEKKYCIHVIWE